MAAQRRHRVRNSRYTADSANGRLTHHPAGTTKAPSAVTLAIC